MGKAAEQDQWNTRHGFNPLRQKTIFFNEHRKKEGGGELKGGKKGATLQE